MTFTSAKDLFIEAHEELIQLYLEQHPEATEAEAYDKTAEHADERARDKMADLADTLRQREKEERR
jgi:hypothetical protein